MESNPLSSLTRALCIFFYIYIPILYNYILPFTFATDFVGLPGNSNGRVCLQCGRPRFDPWVRKMPCRKKWQLTPVFLPRKSHGWRSLVQATAHGAAESDTTERLHFRQTYTVLDYGATILHSGMVASVFIPTMKSS